MTFIHLEIGRFDYGRECGLSAVLLNCRLWIVKTEESIVDRKWWRGWAVQVAVGKRWWILDN